MALDYVWEKLLLAVDSMAASEQTVQKRLANAYIFSLHKLKPSDFPAEWRDDFAAFKNAMSKIQSKEQGSAMASALAMDNIEATAWIKKIVEMYDDIALRDPFFKYHSKGEKL